MVFSFISSIWNWLEPTLLLVQLGLNIKTKNHLRVNYANLKPFVEKAFINTKNHLKHFEVDIEYAIPAELEVYLADLKNELKRENEFFIYFTGEIEYRLLKKYRLTDDARFNKFIAKSFLYLNGFHKHFNARLRKEYILNFIKKKNTFFHYISIPDWANLNQPTLITEVKKIKKPSPLWNERYNIDKVNLFEDEENAINRAIDKVLRAGKITEQTILNLASSEKLVIVHKYAEGFSDVYTNQKKELENLKSQIERDKKSGSAVGKKRLPKLNENLENLRTNWIVSPLNKALEIYGFKKLFVKSPHIYILPLSQLPETYQNKPNSFIDNVIVPEAEKYLESVRGSEYMIDFSGGLKFLVIAHTIPINEMNFYTRERSLEISSKTLAKLLFTSFLQNEEQHITSIYINDIVRNVDFKSQISENSKTGKYLLESFEELKSILWKKYKIEISKPITMISLSEQNVEEVVEELIKLKPYSTPRLVRKMINDKISFYKELNQELEQIKKGKK